MTKCQCNRRVNHGSVAMISCENAASDLLRPPSRYRYRLPMKKAQLVVDFAIWPQLKLAQT